MDRTWDIKLLSNGAISSPKNSTLLIIRLGFSYLNKITGDYRVTKKINDYKVLSDI